MIHDSEIQINLQNIFLLSSGQGFAEKSFAKFSPLCIHPEDGHCRNRQILLTFSFTLIGSFCACPCPFYFDYLVQSIDMRGKIEFIPH
jgi:hypothetical protein